MEGYCSVNYLLQLPLFPHLETLEVRCHKKLISVRKFQHSPFLNLRLRKEPVQKKTWTLLRCPQQILECTYNLVACTDLAFSQTDVHPSEEEISKAVIFHIGQAEAVELVSCKTVWVQIGQPDEIELICIN
uniref:Uncharacterized protein n=1 Tax=Leersia perrieri TaxID=77586 RepID=A0A0D9W743_9ORYZ